MSKYIEKAIENSQGHVNNCWEVINGNFVLNFEQLGDQVIPLPDENKNKGTLTIVAWKNVDARVNLKGIADRKRITINLEDIPSFEQFFDDVASYLINDVNSPFKDGVIKDTSDYTPEEGE